MQSLLATFVIVVLDQTTKYFIRFYYAPGESKAIVASCFDFTHVRNTGAVWGCLQNQNEWLALVSLFVLALMAVFFRAIVNNRMIYSVAVGCIAGGIIGNLIDRIKLGWVTDFLDFYWNGRHWPSFNIADSAICAGVACYLIASFRETLKEKK